MTTKPSSSLVDVAVSLKAAPNSGWVDSKDSQAMNRRTSTVNEMSAPASWKRISLREVAHVQTGISVSANRDLSGATEELPYLRVANVKDG